MAQEEKGKLIPTQNSPESWLTEGLFEEVTFV